MYSFLQRRILYSWPHKSLLWIKKLSSNNLHSIQVDIWNRFCDMNKYMTKSCPSWKNGDTSFLGIGLKLDMPLIHTHHIYMYEHLFFWMLRVQIIRICNVEMKIWGCSPFSGVFSKWLLWTKYPTAKNWDFRISTSNYQIYKTHFAIYVSDDDKYDDTC